LIGGQIPPQCPPSAPGSVELKPEQRDERNNQHGQTDIYKDGSDRSPLRRRIGHRGLSLHSDLLRRLELAWSNKVSGPLGLVTGVNEATSYNRSRFPPLRCATGLGPNPLDPRYYIVPRAEAIKRVLERDVLTGHTVAMGYRGSLFCLIIGLALFVLGAFAWPGLIGEALIVVGLVGLVARFVTSRVWGPRRVD
jgi:hypothetical protein